MKRNKKSVRNIFSIKSYIFYFLLLAFVITCCFLLFLNHLNVDYGSVEKSAKLTFINILFISLVFTLLDGIYRKITVERPLRSILEATEKLTGGNFSVRIKPFHGYDSNSALDTIIENFNKMAEELSGVETLRNDFISNVSHEIKTPLAVIKNYAAMLKRSDITEEERIEYAGIIEQSSARLSNLITNILKLNKLENQQIFPDVKEFDLGNQLCECILNMEELFERKNLELDTDIEEGVKIKSDEELLSIVWNNILSNAIKFTDEGGLITVSLRKNDDRAEVDISDTGCGISPDVGRRIFEKFYQGDESHSGEGNGLGLALVKRVIDITGGEIFVESERGKGSKFIIKLPVG